MFEFSFLLGSEIGKVKKKLSLVISYQLLSVL